MDKSLLGELSLGQKSSLDKSLLGELSLGQKSLGQLSPWTIAPWTIVATLFYRPCTTRSFNQSPLCKVGIKNREGPVKWADKVTKVYQNTGNDPVPDYVRELETSSRSYYGTHRIKTEELFEHHLKVSL